jgi:hypothetical protein
MANRFGLNKKGRKQVKKLTKAMGGKRVEALTGFNLMTGKVSHSVSKRYGKKLKKITKKRYDRLVSKGKTDTRPPLKLRASSNTFTIQNPLTKKK